MKGSWPVNLARWPLAATLMTTVLLLVPGAFYVWTPRRWQGQHLSPLNGDEPHYLITADALLTTVY